MPPRLSRIVLPMVSVGIAIALVEVTLRVAFGVPVFSWRDLRVSRLETLQKPNAIYDAQLGWVQRPGISGSGFNTIDYGIRKNSLNDETVSPGGILAVGDSFTAGSEVVDEDSWPAQLERLTGQRVFNAAVGGYGADQSIMAAERLLPLLKPKVVLVGMLVPDDVQRVGYSMYGKPKPFFTRQQNQVVLMNQPVPEDVPSEMSLVKRVMVHLMIFHVTFERLRPFWWFGDLNGQHYERAANNPSAVTCYLLGRLHEAMAPSGARGVVVLQHGGWIYARKQSRSAEADAIDTCAGEAGLEVVDEFDAIHEISGRSLDDLKQLYVMHDNGTVYGHMSGKGNEQIATLVARKLGAPIVAKSRDEVAHAVSVEGDGLNRLAGVEPARLQRANTTVETPPEKGPVASEPVIRLTATPESAEHYVSVGWSADQPGLYTFSVYIREMPRGGLRLQLLDAEPNGVIGDFSYGTHLFDLFKIGGGARLDFSSENANGGWMRLAATAELKRPAGSIIMQLRDGDGKTNFPGGSVTMTIQAPMVERGGAASTFCRPGACPASGARATH